MAEPRTTLHGRSVHVEDAILEAKSTQEPRPPVMIAGGAILQRTDQMTAGASSDLVVEAATRTAVSS
jgi:alkanesulfonate monooxygenase SsuD/methylene tetrahydromethanopterin reductase-like flavin-dependent oxidoreductase (luciferase family)